MKYWIFVYGIASHASKCVACIPVNRALSSKFHFWFHVDTLKKILDKSLALELATGHRKLQYQENCHRFHSPFSSVFILHSPPFSFSILLRFHSPFSSIFILHSPPFSFSILLRFHSLFSSVFILHSPPFSFSILFRFHSPFSSVSLCPCHVTLPRHIIFCCQNTFRPRTSLSDHARG